MFSNAIIPSKNRDQIKIEELQLDLQSKCQQVAEMTLDLEDLKLEVRHFQKEYNLRVAETYIELDKVNLSIKEYRLRLRLVREGVCQTKIEERVASCFKSERRRLEDYEHDAMELEKETEEDSNKNELSVHQTRQIRKLYLKLAKIYHPDKSTEGEQGYERQKQMMTVINRAYEDRDLGTLKRMNVESIDEIGFHSHTSSEKKRHLTEQLNRVMRSVGDLRLEINRIKSGEIYQLKQEVSKTREKGVDLIANLVKDIQRKVNANQRKLTDLISIFQQLSARPQPMD